MGWMAIFRLPMSESDVESTRVGLDGLHMQPLWQGEKRGWSEGSERVRT
jgi:hypothetical protein